MKITMNDIAKATGVSQPTISRILNGNANVSNDKKIKVLDYIEKVGYRPNLVAKSLKNNNSHLIGLCVPDLLNPYFIELINSLEEIAKKNKYSLLIHSSNRNPIIEWECISDFIDRKVDGIAFIPCSNLNLTKLLKTNLPLVILTQIKENIDSVGVNHFSGGALAAKHLLNLGHQRIGFIGGLASEDEKFMGFQNELNVNGIDLKIDDFLHISDYTSTSIGLKTIIKHYFKERFRDLPTAYFAGNDLIAFEIIKALDDLNINVPDDISVLGFDDTIIAKALKITSIKQPLEDMAKIGFEFLLNKIKSKNERGEIEKIVLDPFLFKRKSTKLHYK